MKKTIIIISIILCVLAVLAGVYFAWKKTQGILTPPAVSPPIVNQLTNASTTGQPAPTLPAPKLKIISSQPIFDYWIFHPVAATSTKNVTNTIPVENEIFYLSQSGQIFKLNATSGQPEAINAEPITNLQKIKLSFDGRRIIIKSGDLVSPKFTIFNSETGVFELLPDNIAAAAFSPDAKKVVYLERATGNLMTKDLVGIKPKTTKILSLTQNDFDLDWILPQEIILTPKPSSFYLSSAWALDITKKTIIPLGDASNGLMINWSASGKLGLKFSSPTTISLINEQGLAQGNLNFITMPDKCFIAEPKIYCAIPANIPQNTVLPDDYLKQAVYFKDSLYQIDIGQNSLSALLNASDLTFDAFDLTLFNNQLFFINRYDSQLYRLDL